MKLSTYYLLKEFFKVFLLLLLVVLAFYLIIDFFEKFPAFLGAKKTFLNFFKYIFWKIQLNLSQIYPYVLALSLILFLLFLSRASELLALLSLGFKREEIFSILSKILLILSLIGALFLNILTPKAFFEAQKIWTTEIEEKKSLYLIFKGEIFFEGENFLLVARPIEPQGEYLSEVTLIYLEKKQPVKILWAKSALYNNKKWQLEEVICQEKSDDFKPRFFKSWQGDLPFKPKALVITEKPVKFLSIKELYLRLSFLKKVGRPLDEILGEFFNRVLYCLLGYLLGLPPLYLYLRYFSPHRHKISLFAALGSFFVLASLYLFLQTLATTHFYLSLVLLIPLFMINLGIHFKRSYFPLK